MLNIHLHVLSVKIGDTKVTKLCLVLFVWVFFSSQLNEYIK